MTTITTITGEPESLFTTAEAAAFARYSAGYLRNLRSTGAGPAYLRSTPTGGVRYTRSGLLAWLQSAAQS